MGGGNSGFGGSRDFRTALDVKVINGLGQGHFTASLQCGLSAASQYREQQMENLNTRELCSARGIWYEPVVFTVQGGIERHGEALLSRISQAVAKEEGISPAEAKAELVESISLSIGRSAAKAILRRRPVPAAVSSELRRTLDEAHLLED